MRQCVGAAVFGLAVMVAGVSCAGPRGVASEAQATEANIDDKYLRTAVTWGLVIIPVYAWIGQADRGQQDPLGFWTRPTAESPTAPGDTPMTAEGSKQAVQVLEHPDGSATFKRGDRAYQLIPTGENAFQVQRDGVQIGRAEITPDGGLLAMDAKGQLLQTLSSAEIDARAKDIQLIMTAL